MGHFEWSSFWRERKNIKWLIGRIHICPFFKYKRYIHIGEHVCVCAQAWTAEAVASEPSLPEFLLMGWALTRVPMLFMNFSSALLVSFCFWFHNILWPAPTLSEPIHCFSGETDWLSILRLSENPSHEFSSLGNQFSPDPTQVGKYHSEPLNQVRIKSLKILEGLENNPLTGWRTIVHLSFPYSSFLPQWRQTWPSIARQKAFGFAYLRLHVRDWQGQEWLAPEYVVNI